MRQFALDARRCRGGYMELCPTKGFGAHIGQAPRLEAHKLDARGAAWANAATVAGSQGGGGRQDDPRQKSSTQRRAFLFQATRSERV
jgi:hypothetical protein